MDLEGMILIAAEQRLPGYSRIIESEERETILENDRLPSQSCVWFCEDFRYPGANCPGLQPGLTLEHPYQEGLSRRSIKRFRQ